MSVQSKIVEAQIEAYLNSLTPPRSSLISQVKCDYLHKLLDASLLPKNIDKVAAESHLRWLNKQRWSMHTKRNRLKIFDHFARWQAAQHEVDLVKLLNGLPSTRTLLRGRVKVIHGSHNETFNNLTGCSVELIRLSLQQAFNISPEASAQVNGFEVGRDRCLGDGDVLEFVRRWGFKAADSPTWMSLKEAAAYLGVGEKSLKALCREGKVAFIQSGYRGCKRTGEFRFQATWLDEYIEREMHQVSPSYKQIERPRRRPQMTEVFIDPRECGNPFENS